MRPNPAHSLFDPADDAEEARAMTDLAAGRVVSHEVVSRWLESWGTENELPKPECR